MDLMIYGGIVAVVIMLLAWWCGRKMGADYVAFGDVVLPFPANRLEELLIDAVDTGEMSELMAELKRATLIVPCGADGTMMYMTFSFPPELADDSDDYELNENGEIATGPFVFCYTSHALAEQIRRNSDLDAMLVTIGGICEMGQRPAQEVFAFALSKDATLRLNAFGGFGYQFVREELLELTKAD